MPALCSVMDLLTKKFPSLVDISSLIYFLYRGFISFPGLSFSEVVSFILNEFSPFMFRYKTDSIASDYLDCSDSVTLGKASVFKISTFLSPKHRE